MNIIQIVPQLPPAINGVGDYALSLARQMRQDFDLGTHFIVGDHVWSGTTEVDGFAVSQLKAHSPATLLALLQNSNSTTVLLHYVGYGYAKRGCPTWLINSLEQWKANHPKARLATMFHEVYASGPPWTSAFWLSALQKGLAARLARVSDRLLTSKELYAEILQKMSRGKHTQIPTLPVFSSVGEPESLLTLAQRKPQLVVFGGHNNRGRVYQKSLAKLNLVCQTLGIKEIIDIGSPTGLSLSTMDTVPIVEMGQQSIPQVSEILSNALVGFLDYNPGYLAKSSIFAAYCAHGLLPINALGSFSLIDGIMPGEHYWFPDQSLTHLNSWKEMQAIANNAHDWYQSHNICKQSQVFYGFLQAVDS